MFELIKNSILTAAGIAGFLAVLCAPTTSSAADFQIAVKRLSVTQCNMTGSILNIDPATGNVSIDLGSNFNCYPAPVNSLVNSASLSVTSGTTIGGGTNGTGAVDLALNTGLAAATPGVTCVPDGYTSTNVNITSGWTATLCGPSDCGPTVTRNIAVQNPSATTNGSITFKAKCTYQDQSNANLTTERKNIQSAPLVSVLHGTIPQVSFCQSVSELSNTRGLTPAMRQLTGTVTGGLFPGTGRDFTTYTAVFGSSADTYLPGDPDTAGYGFPGNNRTNVQLGLQRDKYISFQFRAPSNPIWSLPGSFLVIPGNSFTLASISPCPGQFSSDVNFPTSASCHIVGKQQNLNFKITNDPTYMGCKLIPGKTYYLNLINASMPDLSQSTCSSSLCSPKVNLQMTNP